jgi:hypothetical protein
MTTEPDDGGTVLDVIVAERAGPVFAVTLKVTVSGAGAKQSALLGQVAESKKPFTQDGPA